MAIAIKNGQFLPLPQIGENMYCLRLCMMTTQGKVIKHLPRDILIGDIILPKGKPRQLQLPRDFNAVIPRRDNNQGSFALWILLQKSFEFPDWKAVHFLRLRKIVNETPHLIAEAALMVYLFPEIPRPENCNAHFPHSFPLS